MVLSDKSLRLLSKQSGVAQLVRTACKTFRARGNDEAGVACFSSYLADQSDKSQFAPFIGNVFNILFYNPAGFYYLADNIKDFIRKFPNLNNLNIKAVQEDITNEVFLAETRALKFIKSLTASL